MYATLDHLLVALAIDDYMEKFQGIILSGTLPVYREDHQASQKGESLHLASQPELV